MDLLEDRREKKNGKYYDVIIEIVSFVREILREHSKSPHSLTGEWVHGYTPSLLDYANGRSRRDLFFIRLKAAFISIIINHTIDYKIIVRN